MSIEYLHSFQLMLIILTVLALLTPTVFTSDTLSDNEFNLSLCNELGFTDTLQCNTCNTLYQYINDIQLYNECKQCCKSTDIHTSNSNSNALYSGGLLKVCS